MAFAALLQPLPADRRRPVPVRQPFFAQSGLFSLEDVSLARWTSVSYFAAALFFLWFARHWRKSFNLLLTFEVGCCDILALTLLMYTSGGIHSSMSNMLLVVLAGAGLVGQGRLVLFYAAMATLAVMCEQGYRMLTVGAELADFTHTGIISIGFFATAASAGPLAQRVVADEDLARERGQELGEQFRINQRVIREMQEGVLVVDAVGRVRQHNPQSEMLCEVSPGRVAILADFSREMAPRLCGLACRRRRDGADHPPAATAACACASCRRWPRGTTR